MVMTYHVVVSFSSDDQDYLIPLEPVETWIAELEPSRINPSAKFGKIGWS